MNKEMKETLDRVADYENWVKQKALKAGNLAFASMFLISVGAIIIQLLLTVNLRFVLGETLIALVGGTVYAFIMIHNGIWDKGLSAREALWRDFLTSVICAGIFSSILWYLPEKNGVKRKANNTLCFVLFGRNYNCSIYCLRILSYLNQNRRRNAVKERTSLKTTASCTKIYNAKDIVEAGKIIELFKEHGITAFSQEASANVAMHGMSGFGIYGVDVFVETDEAEKAMQILEDMDASISKEKF